MKKGGRRKWELHVEADSCPGGLSYAGPAQRALLELDTSSVLELPQQRQTMGTIKRGSVWHDRVPAILNAGCILPNTSYLPTPARKKPPLETKA